MGPIPNLVPMVGSSLPKMRSLRERGKLDPNKTLEVVFHLRLHSEPPTSAQRCAPEIPTEGLSQDDFQQQYGASPEDVDAVVEYLAAAGFEDIVPTPNQCMVSAQAPVGQINDAFGIELRKFDCRRGRFFGHTGDIHIPAHLIGIIESVTGLDDLVTLSRIRDEDTSLDDLTDEQLPERPVLMASMPLSSVPDETAESGEVAEAPQMEAMAKVAACVAEPISVLLPPDYRLHFPAEVAALYDFPEEFDGTGETIAIISIGGNFDPDDIQYYFEAQNLKIPDIQVEHVGRRPRTARAPNMHDLELTMDLQIAGSIAPGAKLVVFSVAPGTPQPYLTVLKQAMLHPEHRPSVVSISYGSAEGLFREQDLKTSNRMFAAATQQGITICAASGDAGSASRDYDSMPPPPGTHVNFPASSPYVLACGGTSIKTTGGCITEEFAWNDHDQCRLATAGGISRVFGRPDYQRDLDLPKNRSDWRGFDGRGLPDVAINACLTSGYRILFKGKWLPNGGTSAAAPLWAGLIARLNQGLGHRLGFIHPYLYRLAGTPAFRDITQGSNGFYKARVGWDACTGNGVPVGCKLLAALRREICDRDPDNDTLPANPLPDDPGKADPIGGDRGNRPAPKSPPIHLNGTLMSAQQSAYMATLAAQRAQAIANSLRLR